MKKQSRVISMAIVLGAVAALNVKIVLDTNRSYDLTMANIEAVSGEHGDGGESESGGKLICTTETTNVTIQMTSSTCMLCGKAHKVSEWSTRSCNKGVLSFCYPGYITTYYKCDGTIDSQNDRTEQSTCSIF